MGNCLTIQATFGAYGAEVRPASSPIGLWVLSHLAPNADRGIWRTMVPCGTCGAPIEKAAGRLYCSDACRHKAALIKRRKEQGPCVICGGQITAKAISKYCGDTCRKEVQRLRNQAARKTKRERICG